MKKVIKYISTALLILSTTPAMAWVDHQVQGFLDQLNKQDGKPMEELSINDARDVLVNAQKSVKTDLSGVKTSEKVLMVNNKPLTLTIVKPEGATGTLPVFMFFHGGGWVLGDFQTHARLVRDLVVSSGAAAVFVNYTPSPEARYPVAIIQAYAATKWVADHGAKIGVDGNRLALVGNSVGGNMVAAVALLAKTNRGPAIKYQVLLWPVTDAAFDTDSYKEFAKGYFLTRNMMKWFWDNYTTDEKQREEIYASPLQASKKQLKGLPPALFVIAENDVLRDEGEAYAGKLDEAGVPVAAVRYDGMIHDFGLLNALSQVSGTKAAMLQVGKELQDHLK
ncbi:MAG: alpha/beta hydrolase [Gammaproteobacteria bacterium]